VIEKSLNPGNWDVYWYAELDTVGTDPLNVQNATKNESVFTRHSAVRSFEIQGKLVNVRILLFVRLRRYIYSLIVLHIQFP
jgi:hypothetical protein